ncbi:MAG: hypothetical protein AVDCRST_MAG73-1306 [uncultured Thermomicrobiales bacterium]|uniref:Uncharacterized protein n=1 Tax=uncultured Thermomicrobiales bacterium TaxID=1645740 RepID=A0A6J4U066_9BACT|nr:MAG: hypothetical protein AVDCRST_MAG73-1306 [uncultured Thermomicrobiales bacterium]
MSRNLVVDYGGRDSSPRSGWPGRWGETRSDDAFENSAVG